MPPVAEGTFTGLFAALPTPVRHDGQLDLETFDRLVDFVMTAGVDGICVGGATGEYPHLETAERQTVVARAAGRVGDGALLVAIGAPSLRLVTRLGDAALRAGTRALL